MTLKESLRDIFNILFHKRIKAVTSVIPALNEEKTISKVIRQIKAVPEITQIIVVDDGSTDNTKKIAEENGAEVISHHTNLGKGEAIKTGISHAKEDIILFLDADLKNITSKKIRALIIPILKDKADFVKASFSLARGRVTEFAIKPMMKVLYPETSFKQPISGQFAGRKSFLEKIVIEPRWGIDIAILLDAIKHGERILEVDIGELLHKGRAPGEKSEMSKQVMETMLKKAGIFCSKHKIVLFSDRTIISKNSITEENKKLLSIIKSKRIIVDLITSRSLNSELSSLFDNVIKIKEKGKRKEDEILGIVKKIAKKTGASTKEIVLVVNASGFNLAAEVTDKTFCLNNSSTALKSKYKQINSLSDILIYLE